MFTYKPVASRSPTVAEASALFERSGLAQKHIAAKAGVAVNSLSLWRSGTTTPRVDMLEVALEAIGYRLAIVPIESQDVSHGNGQSAGTPDNQLSHQPK